MPYVNVRVIKDVFTEQQKHELAEKITDAFIAVEGEYMRPYTLITIEEVASGDWVIGGKPISAEMVREVKESTKIAA